MEKIADFCLRSIKVSLRVQEKSGKKLVDFAKALETDEEVKEMGNEVKTWASTFSIPGV